MFTCHDIVTSIQLSKNCNLTVCIFESRHDIKHPTTNFYSVQLKTPKTKLEVIPPKDVEGDTFYNIIMYRCLYRLLQAFLTARAY